MAMSDDLRALNPGEINRCVDDLTKLYELVEDLREKIADTDPIHCAKPEFVQRSLVSIYDAQAVLTKRLVDVLVTLRDGVSPDDEGQAPYDAGPPRKPLLKLVDPD